MCRTVLVLGVHGQWEVGWVGEADDFLNGMKRIDLNETYESL